MIGAIIGDIAGSKYEFNNIKTKQFPLFSKGCEFTDDTVITIAVSNALLKASGGADFKRELIEEMHRLGAAYPLAGYGGRFERWLLEGRTQPYGSFGNGSAMRVSPCGFIADSLEDALKKARQSAEVTHDHPEGIKGAQATAACIFLARTGARKEQIKEYVQQNFYELSETLDEIRPNYYFNETCQQTVPQAIQAFLEAEDFEDAIRNAVSLGGDSDTLACITGGISEAYFGVPQELKEKAMSYLTEELAAAVESFYNFAEGSRL